MFPKIFPASHKVSVKSHVPFRDELSCCNLTCGCRVSNFLWISHKLKVIYLEMPKCGCSSVKICLGIKVTNEMMVEAYLRKQIFDPANDTCLAPIGHGNEVPLRIFRTLVPKVLAKIDDGILETSAVGPLSFQHSFDAPANLIERHRSYKIFTVVRDPLARVISGINMFYNRQGNPGRRIQRLSHSGIILANQPDLSDIIEDIISRPNHHFSPMSSFLGSLMDVNSGVEFVQINDLSRFLFNLVGRSLKANVSPQKLFSVSSLSAESINKLIKIYSKDIRFLHLINNKESK